MTEACLLRLGSNRESNVWILYLEKARVSVICLMDAELVYLHSYSSNFHPYYELFDWDKLLIVKSRQLEDYYYSELVASLFFLSFPYLSMPMMLGLKTSLNFLLEYEDY